MLSHTLVTYGVDGECAEHLYRAVAVSDVAQLNLLPAPPPPKLEKLCGK